MKLIRIISIGIACSSLASCVTEPMPNAPTGQRTELKPSPPTIATEKWVYVTGANGTNAPTEVPIWFVHGLTVDDATRRVGLNLLVPQPYSIRLVHNGQSLHRTQQNRRDFDKMLLQPSDRIKVEWENNPPDTSWMKWVYVTGASGTNAPTEVPIRFEHGLTVLNTTAYVGLNLLAPHRYSVRLVRDGRSILRPDQNPMMTFDNILLNPGDRIQVGREGVSDKQTE